MSVATVDSLSSILESAQGELVSLARESESEIASLSGGFEDLARQSGKMLDLASAVAACIEDESVTSVLPMVQTLGRAARRFVEARLEATNGILETVAMETRTLRRLSAVTRSQAASPGRRRCRLSKSCDRAGRVFGVADRGHRGTCTAHRFPQARRRSGPALA